MTEVQHARRIGEVQPGEARISRPVLELDQFPREAGAPLLRRKITINPAIGMYKPKAPPARDRVLSEAEIKWLWQACDTLGEPLRLTRNPEVLGCHSASIGHFFVLDDLPFIERGKASPFNRPLFLIG